MTSFPRSLRALTRGSGVPSSSYYHWLDVVRGLAAVAILVWHYQSLFFESAGRNLIVEGVYRRDAQPFYPYLSLLYEHGFFAVQLFWLISGFVFASVYRAAPTSGREFFVNRFARLYPLHFATLVLVALLQWVSFAAEREFQIYPYNDAYHFVLNLFFVSHWGLELGESFNSPTWSVSVEIFVYIVFWAVLKVLFRFGIVLPVVFATGFLALFALNVPGPFWECGTYFFIGCAVYVWHQTFRERAVVNAALAVGCVAAGILTLTSAIAHVGDFGRVFLFSGLVLGAATLDATKLRGFAARLSWLGDSTYSLYLLHIPVLLVTILALDLLGFDRYGLAGEEWLFVAYVCLMLALARLSYRYFELPCRRWLRKRLASGPRAEAPSGALAVGSD